MAELTAVTGNRDETLREVLKRAEERLGECDSVVVLMQKKTGGICWEAPEEMQVQSMIFLAMGFVCGMYEKLKT